METHEKKCSPVSGRLHDPLKNLIDSIALMRKDGEQGVEMDSGDAVETLNGLISEARNLMNIESPFPSFGYYINLNERGYFEADVRDQSGKTIFEVKSGLSLAAGESDLIEDGFMKHANDLKGLETYLKSLRLLPDQGRLMSAKKFDEIF